MPLVQFCSQPIRRRSNTNRLLFSQIFPLLEPATCLLQGATWSKSIFPFRLTPYACIPALEAETVFPALGIRQQLLIFQSLKPVAFSCCCSCFECWFIVFVFAFIGFAFAFYEKKNLLPDDFCERVDTASLEFLLLASFPLRDKQK